MIRQHRIRKTPTMKIHKIGNLISLFLLFVFGLHLLLHAFPLLYQFDFSTKLLLFSLSFGFIWFLRFWFYQRKSHLLFEFHFNVCCGRSYKCTESKMGYFSLSIPFPYSFASNYNNNKKGDCIHRWSMIELTLSGNTNQTIGYFISLSSILILHELNFCFKLLLLLHFFFVSL